MKQSGKLSLFQYLSENKEKLALDSHKDINASSSEALAILTALSYRENPRKMFFLFPSIYEAESFNQVLGDYLNENEVFFFPYDEIFRTNAIGVSPEMSEERLLAVSSVFSEKPSILVAYTSSALLRMMPKERYRENLLSIKNGDMLDLSELKKNLLSLGYQMMDRVSRANQIASRGGILDIFDASYENPIRLEFFGDEIEDIRVFHARDEMSFEHINEVVIHPANLKLIDPESIESGALSLDEDVKKAFETGTERLTLDDLKERIEKLKQSSTRGYIDDVDQRFYPYFETEETCLLDYIDGYECYLYQPSEIEDSIQNCHLKEREYFKKTVKANSSIEKESVYVSKKTDFASFASCIYREELHPFVVRPNSFKALSYAQSDQMLNQYIKEGYKIRIALPEPNLANYKNYLSEAGIDYSEYPEHSSLMLYEGRLTHGFEIPEEKHVYLSSREIYGVSEQRSRFLSRYKEAKIIRKYEDLKEGDYVVHEVHGVGRYIGVELLDGLEYLKVEYADHAFFLLPLSQYRMIRKYSSREGYAPSLDKLGGSTWSRKKSKIRSRMTYLADQLLAIYAERQSRPGFAFPREIELEKDFMKTFPYPYTESQRKAIEEVKIDMENSTPMDRLIAGDVGFGKTEIAFNAAFKAILAHKQVAFLCPTTILCNQHYKNALLRFKDYGVRVCAFNRFISKNEQDKNIKLIQEGKMDLIIGTHRLLNDAIKFHDLGLLIVDEEQKFGVAHKEKIKEKAKNVDCLTLTATPIPRTMQMSLLNVRSLSLLDDAPLNRMPVKTYVAKYDKELILEVIQKELDRKGQVYYLHNDIKSIHATADYIQKKFKNNRVSVVHARMSEDEIEMVMDEFYSGNSDILVCTSIIESGLDIPNVNTIIVENSDHFGLAQLYQIKGRVGRSDRLAYAYFLFRDEERMTVEAHKRLKAIKDFTELGSGYKIAMQDLNIRGAGDILGSEQAGFVDSLGYDAYMQLLQDVVKEKKLVSEALEDREQKRYLELNFSLDAHIPEDYGTKEQRISMYRELSDCNSDTELAAFSDKLKDVYGNYPEEVANLLVKRAIEINLNDGLFESFKESLGAYDILTSEQFSSKRGLYKKIEEGLEPLLVKMRVKITGNAFEFILIKTKDYLKDLYQLTSVLKKAYDEA